jgi:predicted DsbA family dithiol-disulfide isomerase
MMTIEVRYYTDPVCTWSWGAEPVLRRLAWEFGDSLRWRLVMGGLARVYGPDYRDEEGDIGSGADCFADLMAHWLDVAARTEMPCDPRLWTQNPLSSSHPACMAVKAASEQGESAGLAYARRVREALMVERKKLDHVEALVAEAGPAGLDSKRFRIDLESNAIIEAFAADLDEVRDVPAQARADGAVRRTEGRERVALPSAVFVGEDGARHGVWGWRPYAAYREAALAAGAIVAEEGRPELLGAIERFGRCATREIEELTGQPRPVVEAELWGLARDWRLKPVPALTGTLWELP